MPVSSISESRREDKPDSNPQVLSCSRTVQIGSGNTVLNLNPDQMKYRVLIERDEDGVFVATVPSLPGCIADGSTREEALSSVREAIALYIESLKEHGDPIPPPITEELVEV